MSVLQRGMTIAEGEPFVLSSGAESWVAFDVANAISGPDNEFVVKYLLDHITVGFEAVAGPALGAAPVVYPASTLAKVHSFMVRTEQKGHGVGGWFKGRFVPGDRILVVEDVVTTGGSLIRAMNVIRDNGGVIVAAATLIDRGVVTGRRIAAEFAVPYFPLTTFDDFGIEAVERVATAKQSPARSEA